ncbi:MAG: PDZ domain-containing protein [Actinobacteria bacterium]|nr:PDZ domain-containing protein [Actinomycetota bacterium]
MPVNQVGEFLVSEKKKSPASKRAVIGGRAKKSDASSIKTRTRNEVEAPIQVDSYSRVYSQGKIITPDLLRKSAIALLITSLVFAIGIQVGESRNASSVDEAIRSVVESSAREIDRDALERAAIEGVLKASGDEWANYFPREALDIFESQSSNSFTGIGIYLSKSRGGIIKISSIQEGSPAEKSDLAIGDELLEVNGTQVSGASLASTIALLRADIGKGVDLVVTRDEKKILATIKPGKVRAKSVELTQVSSSVALIEIASFISGTASEVSQALKSANYSSGVIIDLRNNSGGLVEEAVDVAELFIGNGIIVSYKVNESEKVFRAVNSNPIKVPVVVVINRNTASSAEILAGAFQDRNRGVVIGERSYGKGSVQELISLDDGSKLELTVALFLTPSGRIIEEVGITPDLAVAPAEIGLKSLQVLGGLASFISKD